MELMLHYLYFDINIQRGMRGMAMAWGQGELFPIANERRSSGQNFCSVNIQR